MQFKTWQKNGGKTEENFQNKISSLYLIWVCN